VDNLHEEWNASGPVSERAFSLGTEALATPAQDVRPSAE